MLYVPARVVQTNSGPIRGEELTFEETSYKAFKGIPYAAPPVGNLKFKVFIGTNSTPQYNTILPPDMSE